MAVTARGTQLGLKQPNNSAPNLGEGIFNLAPFPESWEPGSAQGGAASQGAVPGLPQGTFSGSFGVHLEAFGCRAVLSSCLCLEKLPLGCRKHLSAL